jgi:predicted small lipoprotein YifL
MSLFRPFLRVLPLLIVLMLSACGNKGPLVKPVPPATADQPAEPAAG